MTKCEGCGFHEALVFPPRSSLLLELAFHKINYRSAVKYLRYTLGLNSNLLYTLLFRRASIKCWWLNNRSALMYCQNHYILKLFRGNLQSLLHERPIWEKYNSVAAQVPSFVKDMFDTYIDAPVLGSCLNCGHRKPMLPLQARCQKCNRGTSLSHRSHAI